MGAGAMGWLKKNGGMLAVLAVVAGLVAWYFAGSSRGLESQLRQRLTYVCVESGEVFDFQRGTTSTILPLENPKTKRATLIPCTVESGTVSVSPRYRSFLKELGDTNQKIDAETLTLRSTGG